MEIAQPLRHDQRKVHGANLHFRRSQRPYTILSTHTPKSINTDSIVHNYVASLRGTRFYPFRLNPVNGVSCRRASLALCLAVSQCIVTQVESITSPQQALCMMDAFAFPPLDRRSNALQKLGREVSGRRPSGCHTPQTLRDFTACGGLAKPTVARTGSQPAPESLARRPTSQAS